jgi:1,4-dihydroxy-2-naphthoate octaprenyltransferase
MKIFGIILVWLIMGAILVTGVVLAVKGSFWLLIVGLIGFVLGVVKYGIFSH